MRSRALLATLAFILALLLAGPLLVPYNPVEQHRDRVNMAPAPAHWMGTDDYGRDVLSRFLAGGSWSILCGSAATALTLLLGWTVGFLAGYRGGWTDQLLMRFTEVFLSIPWIYALVGMRAALPLTVKPRIAGLVSLLVVSLVSWARPARLVRGVVQSAAERGYVRAARQFGVPEWKIAIRHVLPATRSPLLAQALILLPRFILAEVTLSFVGLAGSGDDPGWGELVAGLKQVWLLPEQWWRVLPLLLMLPLFAVCAAAARSALREGETPV